MSKSRRIKKRYWIPAGLLLILFLLMQLPFLSFRMDVTEWRRFLSERTDLNPEFHQYQLDGRSIHYIHIGEEGSPLVVLVHGSPGSASAFADYLADSRLTSRAQLIAVDRPGFGYSDFGKTERSIEKQARAIKPVIDRHPADKVILVGHSLGGPVVARIAMDFPQLVDALVMIAPSIDPQLEPKEWWRQPLDLPVVRWVLPTSLKVCNQEILPLEGELEQMLPLWENIRASVTIIQGMNDKLVPKENAWFARRMLPEQLPVDIDMIEGGDHFILWTERERIVNAILGYLKKK